MIGGAVAIVGGVLCGLALLAFAGADGDRRAVTGPALAVLLVGGLLVLAGLAHWN